MALADASKSDRDLGGGDRMLFDAIGQHGGVVNPMVGAEITAQFGARLPLPAAPAAQGKPALRLAIGIAGGEVVAGLAGTQQRAPSACVGEPVTLAARLKEQAAAGRAVS